MRHEITLDDGFDYRLLNDLQFLTCVEAARKPIRAGKGTSIEALREQAKREARVGR